jgi:hypothetical protein
MLAEGELFAAHRNLPLIILTFTRFPAVFLCTSNELLSQTSLPEPRVMKTVIRTGKRYSSARNISLSKAAGGSVGRSLDVFTFPMMSTMRANAKTNKVALSIVLPVHTDARKLQDGERSPECIAILRSNLFPLKAERPIVTAIQP